MLDIASAAAEIEALRVSAGFFRKKRRSDAELYDVLARCLGLCERCNREPGLLDALKHKHLSEIHEDGVKRRKYFETGADAPLVVCRMVFGGAHNRAAAWRYTAVLREAQKHQLTSETLVRWMMENGGANSLFLARPVAARSAAMKALYLNHRVRVPKDTPFSLTLRWDGRGFFDVIGAEGAEIDAEL